MDFATGLLRSYLRLEPVDLAYADARRDRVGHSSQFQVCKSIAYCHGRKQTLIAACRSNSSMASL